MKTPPNSVEAERAVLGSILLDTTGRDERVMDVCQSSGVTPETFFDPRNRAIYAEMQRMARESKPLDALTLAEEMMKAGTLEAVGGAAYVQSLIDQTPTTAHAEYYINIILGKQLLTADAPLLLAENADKLSDRFIQRFLLYHAKRHHSAGDRTADLAAANTAAKSFRDTLCRFKRKIGVRFQRAQYALRAVAAFAMQGNRFFLYAHDDASFLFRIDVLKASAAASCSFALASVNSVI